MSPKAHIIQGAVSGALLYPFAGENAIFFALSVVLIDIDHAIEYLADTRDFTFKGFFVFYEILLKNLDKNYLGLSIFHTVEFYALGIWLGLSYPVFYYITAGCVFHHLFDIIFLSRFGRPFAKAASITDYLIRRKGHIVSIKDMLRLDNINLEGIRDVDVWKKRWGV